MKAVAERLNQRWGKEVAHYIPEYYDNQAVIDYMTNELGIEEPIDEGHPRFLLGFGDANGHRPGRHCATTRGSRPGRPRSTASASHPKRKRSKSARS